jgi:hypothetical protein
MKYYAAPFGVGRGKLNGTIFRVWRGIPIASRFTIPLDKGTLLKYQQMKDGIITPDKFSFPQFNQRRAIMNMLMKTGRDHMDDWIHPVWTPEAKARHLLMSGLNLMVKSNLTALLASMDKATEFYSPAENQIPVEALPTNTIDLKQMQVATGELEGTQSFTCTYATGTGIVLFTWNATIFGNGLDTDSVWAIILAKPVFNSIGRNGAWQPALQAYPLRVAHEMTDATRVDAHGGGAIPAGLTPADLTAFIFFSQVTFSKTNHSDSKSAVVTAP